MSTLATVASGRSEVRRRPSTVSAPPSVTRPQLSLVNPTGASTAVTAARTISMSSPLSAKFAAMIAPLDATGSTATTRLPGAAARARTIA